MTFRHEQQKVTLICLMDEKQQKQMGNLWKCVYDASSFNMT